MQTYLYFQNYQSDSRLIKSIVSLPRSSAALSYSCRYFIGCPYMVDPVHSQQKWLSLSFFYVRSTETIHTGFSIFFVHHYFIANFADLVELGKIEWCAILFSHFVLMSDILPRSVPVRIETYARWNVLTLLSTSCQPWLVYVPRALTYQLLMTFLQLLIGWVVNVYVMFSVSAHDPLLTII